MLTHVVLAFLAATADTTTAPDTVRRVVREFPPVEVRALLTHPRSNQTVHELGARAIRTYPVDGVADVLAMQPGVVATGEELHVRGGRAGETVVTLDGLVLNEPQRHRAADLPLLAVRSIEVVSGMPESRLPGGLAGVIDFHTLDPTARFEGETRWQSDGGLDTKFDRWSARASAPLHVAGLGFAAAADLRMDDTSLPQLRTRERDDWAGLPLGLRADNRLAGWFKLAPVERPQRFALQVFASRQQRRPFDPMWSLDGYVGVDSAGTATFSPGPQPGYARYRAADHLAVTEDRRVGAWLSASAARASTRVSAGLGWLHAHSITAMGGEEGLDAGLQLPLFGRLSSSDPFHVLWGDDPLRRESESDLLQFRADVERSFATGMARAGAGMQYEEVRLEELDGMILPLPLDAFRSYRAYAPGAFAYAQGRWEREGLIVNPGLRAEYFTAGEARDDQTLPAGSDGMLTLSPRIGIAYPLSPRDIFSVAWARAHQAPPRDLLYDNRVSISNRQPLGNPALRPTLQISYEAAVKHLFSREWALQSSVFYRDVAREAGARNYAVTGPDANIRYTDDDQASAAGFEWNLRYERGDQRRLELSYTFLRAWGYESRPEGDPYGAVREVKSAPIGETPLSWDRRHSVLLAGFTRWRDQVAVAWSTALGSPLPWTPKPRRFPPADLSATNSRRLGWSEVTNLDLRYTPPRVSRLTIGLEVRNLFDHRGEIGVSVDGYPNPFINTRFDDYAAYRDETGLGGGAYWTGSGWVAVHDPRLYAAPRHVRMSFDWSW